MTRPQKAPRPAGRLQIRLLVDDPARPWQDACIAGLSLLDGVDVDLGPEPETRPDLVIDVRSAGDEVRSWDSEHWRLGFGPDLRRDARQAVLRAYVGGGRVLRVALIREPGSAVIREGVVEAGAWWHPAHLDRGLGSVSDWVAMAVAERVDERVATATRQAAKAAASRQAEGGVADPNGMRVGDSTRTTAPSRGLMAVATARRALAVAERLVRHEEWHLGVVDRRIEQWLDPGFAPPVRWLPLPAGHFAADPFAVVRDERVHVFFEDLDQRAGIGTIHHLVLDSGGRPSSPEQVLDPGVLASYPYLVEDGPDVFMLPEIAAAGELVLYRAEPFPTRWEPVQTLLPGVPALDPTVVRCGERWWLFATRLDRGPNSELFAWHAERLVGPWIPHRNQPVKTDAGSARPAGTPFLHNGSIYRPSQDSSRTYGGRVVINRIDELTPTTFRETPVRVVEPTRPFRDGVHTLSAAGDWTLIDGKRRPFVAGAFRREVGRYARGVGRRLGRS